MAVLEEVAPADIKAGLEGMDRRLVASFAALASYVGLMAFVVPQHEPWFDEAQAWLIARDSNLVTLFQRLPYEGQPGLWHLLLMLPSKALGYGVLNWISGALGAAAAYVFLHRSPFPTPVKVLVPFTYFLFYQYGVVARNYALVPLALFGVAVFYPQRHERPVAYGALLFVLANTSTHGFLIAGALLGIQAAEVLKRAVETRTKPDRRDLAPVAAVGMGLGLVALMMRPPSDRTFAPGGVELVTFGRFFATTGRMLNGSMAESWPVLVLALAASLWFFRRRRVLHLYAVPTILLLLFFGLVHRAPWHEGVLFLVWIFAFWLALQKGPEEGRWGMRSRAAALTMLAVVCAFQIGWSIRTAVMDVSAPYSGSKDLATHIHQNGLANSTIFALHWASFAVNPYFEENIIANYRVPEDISYWLWSEENEMIQNLTTIEWLSPDFVIYPIKRPGSEENAFRSLVSYRQRAVFWGELFWKGDVLQPEVYILFERTTPDPAA